MGSDNFNFSAWIGNRESAEDDITIQAFAAMSATLDRDDPAPLMGDPLPTLWHWMYFSPEVRRSGLGPDGHPSVEEFCHRFRCLAVCSQAHATLSTLQSVSEPV